MNKNTVIVYHNTPTLNKPIALIGSPGLRSIGILAIDYLINEIKPKLMAELYSTHFPLVHQTKPSYVSDPELPGIAGIKIESGEVEFPKIQFYYHYFPPLIITRGYHANFNGQYEVAEKVLDFYKEVQVSRIIVVAGHGLQDKKVCCAANNKAIIEEMKKIHVIEVGYQGPFYGLSGIVFGLSKLKEIEALCLFVGTKPSPEDPEHPDEEASKTLFNELKRMLNLEMKPKNTNPSV
jgi:proteasome assembly chaperone (PAC2) family protein